MHDEDGFLAAIHQAPADDTARLVFADWLDEQGDAISKTKAAFIRLELYGARSTCRGSNRVRWRNELQQLAVQFEPGWLAVVSHPKFEACRLSFCVECPKQWARLAPTSDPKIRHCRSCNQAVHYCDTHQEAQGHATNGTRFARSLALACEALCPRPWPRRMRSWTPRPSEPILPHRLRFPVANRSARPPIITRPPGGVNGSQPTETTEPEHGLQPPVLGTSPQEPRRQKGRHRHRNLQRENWEEPE